MWPFCNQNGARDADSQVVAVLRGELDVVYAASFAAKLAAIAASQREIIVDLEGLQFIDSSGVAALVRVRKHARNAGGDLLLAAGASRPSAGPVTGAAVILAVP